MTAIADMTKQQRLVFIGVLLYVFVSVSLFAIFVFTYRTYWYRNQEQMTVTRALQNERIYLNAVFESHRSLQNVEQAQLKTRLDLLKSIARVRLEDLMISLEARSSQLQVKVKDRRLVEEPVNDDKDSQERFSRLLSPVVSSLKSEQKAFLEILERFNNSSEGQMVFKRFSNSVEQMVDMNYILVDQAQFEFQMGKEKVDWQIRAYVIPPKPQLNDHSKELLAELNRKDPYNFKRLGIYNYDDKNEFSGIDHKPNLSQLPYIKEQGIKRGTEFFNSPEPLKIKTSGQKEKLLMNSYLTSPQLKKTFALHRSILEDEWMQFSFYDRNKHPIILYIALAWIICPILMWYGFRTATRFQFKFTADLNAEDDDFSLKSHPPDQEENHKQTDLMASSPQNKGNVDSGSNTEGSTDQQSFIKDEPVQKTLAEALNLEKKEDQVSAPFFENSITNSTSSQNSHVAQRNGSMEHIRTNNIRKSSGDFNRHQDQDSNVDYLAGVQSEVLKSLIKRLREE